MNWRLSPEFWTLLEQNRLGVMCIVLVTTGCIGGIAAAFGAGESTFQLALTAFPTIVSLALVLGLAPLKAIIYLGIAALVLDACVLIFKSKR